MGGVKERLSKTKFTLTAEYAPDGERMLRALLLALGLPLGEIKHLLDGHRREQTKMSLQTKEGIGKT